MSTNFKKVLEQSQQYGVETLPTPELFTLILCGSGSVSFTKQEKALELIKQLLTDRSDTSALLSVDVCELLAANFDDKLAYRLIALLEVYRRLSLPAEDLYQIRCPGDIAKLVMSQMSHLTREQMRVLVLDKKNYVVLNQKIYQGTVNSSVIRAAEVFRDAVVRNCPAIAICHNHPSGDPEPSPEDIEVTEQLVTAGKSLDIELVDHIVIGNNTYTSLRERLRWHTR